MPSKYTSDITKQKRKNGETNEKMQNFATCKRERKQKNPDGAFAMTTNGQPLEWIAWKQLLRR